MIGDFPGTKESGYVSAVTAAAITYSIAKVSRDK